MLVAIMAMFITTARIQSNLKCIAKPCTFYYSGHELHEKSKTTIIYADLQTMQKERPVNPLPLDHVIYSDVQKCQQQQHKV